MIKNKVKNKVREVTYFKLGNYNYPKPKFLEGGGGVTQKNSPNSGKTGFFENFQNIYSIF